MSKKRRMADDFVRDMKAKQQWLAFPCQHTPNWPRLRLGLFVPAQRLPHSGASRYSLAAAITWRVTNPSSLAACGRACGHSSIGSSITTSPDVGKLS